jgi:hypothetical protein
LDKLHDELEVALTNVEEAELNLKDFPLSYATTGPQDKKDRDNVKTRNTNYDLIIKNYQDMAWWQTVILTTVALATAKAGIEASSEPKAKVKVMNPLSAETEIEEIYREFEITRI